MLNQRLAFKISVFFMVLYTMYDIYNHIARILVNDKSHLSNIQQQYALYDYMVEMH